MDGTDRRIYQRWHVRVGDYNVTIEEVEWHKRSKVRVAITGINSGSGTGTDFAVADLDATIRMLTLARERLETLGTLDGLDKVVP